MGYIDVVFPPTIFQITREIKLNISLSSLQYLEGARYVIQLNKK